MRIALSRCVVRPFVPGDAESLAAHANNRTIWLQLRDRFPHPYTIEDARAWLASLGEETNEAVFAIDVEGAAVGGIGVRLSDDVERVSAEIGYWLGEAHWGRGIMTEALAAVTRHSIDRFALTRVFAVPFADNVASCRVLEKCGYVLEGEMRRSAIKDGRIRDQRLYAFRKPSACL